eukprot:3716031-Amphidinium_carterae.1
MRATGTTSPVTRAPTSVVLGDRTDMTRAVKPARVHRRGIILLISSWTCGQGRYVSLVMTINCRRLGKPARRHLLRAATAWLRRCCVPMDAHSSSSCSEQVSSRTPRRPMATGRPT